MSKYKYINIENWNIKSKRRRNQFINEFLKSCYSDLMITEKEFIKRHKEEVISMFDAYGWDYSTQGLIEDGIWCYYTYTNPDPIYYTICNMDDTSNLGADKDFITLFGKDILKNKKFIRKIKALRHKEINDLEY
ncbi:hypothetical protein [Clostridium botulinum]|uniref:hypothetical protein n=1 Tax=Clostridium botulinum TaxID=1491 RepID=UPI00057EDF86|nr:hypothetical protein [Clostridium botulinum]QPW62061.1 hypothetical protein IG390_13435 [Clostridium botulinum]